MLMALGGKIVQAIDTWLKAHPKAVVISVAAMTAPDGTPPVDATFIWVVDGEDFLNVDLVRQGLLSPESQVNVEKEKLKVSTSDYSAFSKRVVDAGQQAKEQKRGIWMDLP